MAQASGQRNGEGKAGLWKCVVEHALWEDVHLRLRHLTPPRAGTGRLRIVAQEAG